MKILNRKRYCEKKTQKKHDKSGKKNMTKQFQELHESQKQIALL